MVGNRLLVSIDNRSIVQISLVENENSTTVVNYHQQGLLKSFPEAIYVRAYTKRDQLTNFFFQLFRQIYVKSPQKSNETGPTPLFYSSR